MPTDRVLMFPVQIAGARDVERYEAYMKGRRFTAETIYHRCALARRVLREWGTWNVAPERIAAFLDSYPNANTRFTYYGHLRALYTWLLEDGRLRSDPLATIAPPKKPRPNPRPLSRDDARRSLDEAEGDMIAYLMLGRLLGFRAHEIAKFRGEDIDAERVYVLGKGRKEAYLPTHPHLWDLAQRYPREGYWFPSPRKPGRHITPHVVTMRVSRYFDELKIVGSSHRNRHYYGTELLRAGANLRVVQELMRHSDLMTTARYLGVDEDEKVAAIRLLSA